MKYMDASNGGFEIRTYANALYRTPDRIFINLARSQETGDRRQEVRGKMWGEIIQKIQHSLLMIFGQN
ncbi:MAG: hypothetical protein F6K24_30010 [Okeania sp. SIO2D1]|nr:hypothetical protein [Okeania sp. SIO2D1]